MDLADKSDTEILAVVNPIMDRLMEASTAIDYERHVQDFTDRARRALPADRFRAVCESYQSTKGFFARREPVAIFRRPDSLAIVWRQWFTGHPGEFVAEIVLVTRNDKHQVDHVMIF